MSSEPKIVELKIILELWKQDEIHPLIKEKCDSDPEISEFVGYLFMIKLGRYGNRIPDKFKFGEIYKMLIKYDPFNIIFCKEDQITYEDYKSAVIRDSTVLSIKPIKSYMTKEVCDIAFKVNPTLINCFPEQFVTEEMCKHVLESYGSFHISKRLSTPELVKSSIHKNGSNISELPESERSNELLDIALRTYGLALQYYKEEDRTYERCVVAVLNDGTALAHVPLKFRDLNMCKLAVKSKGCMLKFVPVDLQPQLYDIALSADGCERVSKMIPESELTKERVELALNKGDKAFYLSYIPEKWKTEELCMKAIEKGCSIYHPPNFLKNSEFYEKIVMLYPRTFQEVPSEFKSFKMVKFITETIKTAYPYNIGNSIPVKFINHKLFFP